MVLFLKFLPEKFVPYGTYVDMYVYFILMDMYVSS